MANEHPFYLAGQWHRSAEALPVTSPWDDSVVGSTWLASEAQVEDATAAAVAAAPTMAKLPAYERGAILAKASAVISRRRAEIGRALAGEAGKPIRDALTEVDRAAMTFHVAGEAMNDSSADIGVPRRTSASPLFYVGSRGHHADIGGITPGSMPPFSKRVEEEGVLLDNVKLVEDSKMLEAQMRHLLAAARYPARNPDQNIADLRAQVAANEKGVQELRRMVAHFGLDVVKAYMGHVQDNAEECVRRVIGVLKNGEFVYEMDNGAVIRVRIGIGADRRSAVIDFAGTTGQLESNFNAPSAVVYAAVLYVFRTLVDDDIPLNAGCLKPLEVRIPEGCDSGLCTLVSR